MNLKIQSSTPRNSSSSPRPPRSLFLLIAAALASTASAQDLAIKSPPQTKPIAIFNATIHPVSSADIPNGAIVFDKGKITQVLTQDQWNKASTGKNDWKQFDGHGGHVYPGMVSAYTQMGMTEFGAVRATNDADEAASPISPEVRAVTAVNPDSTLIPVTRSNGILTCAVFPTGGIIGGQVSVIRMEGWTTSDLTVMPSLGVAVRWPASRAFRFGGFDRPGADEEQQQPDRSLSVITEAFDTAIDYDKAKAADPSMPTDLRWEAMRPLFHSVNPGIKPGTEKNPEPQAELASQSKVFILANDVDQITSAIAFCMARHLKPVIVGGRDAALCADLLKQHDVPVIIQGTLRMPRHDDAPYDEAYTLPARLHAAGVKFCIATSDETAHERNLPYNAAMAAAHGLPPDAALKSVTQWPAQILGIDDQVGTLEVGHAACLVLTDGNPLEVRTHVEAAFIEGRDVDLTNKQTKLNEKYRERYRQLGLLKDPTVPPEKPQPGN